ncbi:hypothetical protein GW17_00052959 [Ensete ventricosum]|nr:hypothetical protein GW17_00052959 [Ensete ventricosum]
MDVIFLVRHVFHKKITELPSFGARFSIPIYTACTGRYIPVRQVTGMWTARYRVVPPKSTVGFSRRRSIEGEIDRRQSIEGEKGKKKKKKRKRRKKKKRRTSRRPRPHAVAARGRFFSHTRRKIEATDAALVAPLRNIFPGVPWICSSSGEPRGRLLGPLRCRLVSDAGDAGDDGLEPPLCPSDGRQEPSGRALITSNMHSSAARQRNQTFQIGGSVETPHEIHAPPRLFNPITTTSSSSLPNHYFLD